MSAFKQTTNADAFTFQGKDYKLEKNFESPPKPLIEIVNSLRNLVRESPIVNEWLKKPKQLNNKKCII